MRRQGLHDEHKRPRGRPAPNGRKISVTIRLTPAAVAWLDRHAGDGYRSVTIEDLIRAQPTFETSQQS